MSKLPNNEKIYIGGLIPIELHREFSQLAADNERSATAELKIAIKNHLVRQRQKTQARSTIARKT